MANARFPAPLTTTLDSIEYDDICHSASPMTAECQVLALPLTPHTLSTALRKRRYIRGLSDQAATDRPGQHPRSVSRESSRATETKSTTKQGWTRSRPWSRATFSQPSVSYCKADDSGVLGPRFWKRPSSCPTETLALTLPQSAVCQRETGGPRIGDLLGTGNHRRPAVTV